MARVHAIRPGVTIVALIGVLGLAGCEQAMQGMYDQPRYEPLEASEFFADGQAARPYVAGTVAHGGGALAGAAGGRVDSFDSPARSAPLPYTRDLLARGRERFTIYCAPCHGAVGDGEGMIVKRGFPQPPTYHSQRLRAVPDEYIYRVITQGYGVMFSYAEQIPPDDRWAIVAYIRALQLSQHANHDDLTAAERQLLRKAP